MEIFNFFPTTHTKRRKTQYVRFEDRSVDNSRIAEPRATNTGKILNGATVTEVIINSTRDILLNKYPSSTFFLSNLFSKPSTSNTRLNGVRQQTNINSFIDSIDDYDHKSGYSTKVRMIIFKEFDH